MSQRIKRNPPTDPRTMPTTVPGAGPLFSWPYVVGIMPGVDWSFERDWRDLRGCGSAILRTRVVRREVGDVVVMEERGVRGGRGAIAARARGMEGS